MADETNVQTDGNAGTQEGETTESLVEEQSLIESDTEESTEGGPGDGKSLLDDEEGGEDSEGEDSGESQEEPQFELPEGMEMDMAALEQAKPLFKELNLDQAGQQKLVTLYAGLRSKMETEAAQALNKQRQEWREEFKKDPDHQKTLASAKKALTKFGDDEFSAMLKGSWMGDHPGLLNFLARVGQAVSDDTFVKGKSTRQSPRTAEEVLFGDMFDNK